MAKIENAPHVEVNPLLFRYPPNNRFINGNWKNQVEQKIIKDDFGQSITDKESYRLSLASKRGAIGDGSKQAGWYMFPDGRYDPDLDFSYIMRSDLSIVEIDEYINNLQKKLETSDQELSKYINEQLEAAKEYKESLNNKDSNNNLEDSAE